MPDTSLPVVLAVRSEGKHDDGPDAAVIWFTKEHLNLLRREIQQAAAAKAGDDPDLASTRRRDRRVRWLQWGDLAQELREATSFDRPCGGWAVMPAELADRIAAVLADPDPDRELEYRAAVNQRTTDDEEVCWLACPEDACPEDADFSFSTAALTLADLAALAARLDA